MNVREVRPNIWHIEEDYRVYCTLVQGKTLAILWDTGQGKKDLRHFIKGRVNTELLVFNSHGHADHIGGNGRFETVYANRADWPLIQGHIRLTGAEYHLKNLEPGQRFDLGGLHARVVSLAGHTQGSVGLLLEEERLLLAGDGLNPTLLLLGQEAASFDDLRQTLMETEKLSFDQYLASHSPNPLSRDLVGVHLRHLDHLQLDLPARPGPYGPQVCRSIYKEPAGRSYFLVNKRP